MNGRRHLKQCGILLVLCIGIPATVSAVEAPPPTAASATLAPGPPVRTTKSNSVLARMTAALHLNESRFAAGVGVSAGIPGFANIEPWGGFILSGKDTGDKKRFRGLGAITGNLVLGLYGTYVHKPQNLRGSAFGGTLGPFSLTTVHPLFKSRMLYFTLPHIMSVAAGDDVIGGTIALPIPFLPPALRQTYCMFIQHPWLRPVNRYFMGPINRGAERLKLKLSPVVQRAKARLAPITQPIIAAAGRVKRAVKTRWQRSRFAKARHTPSQ